MQTPNTKVLLPALLALLVLVGGYFWFSRDQVATPTPVAQVEEKANVEVAQAGASVPEGFPKEIPVDTTTITQSYKAAYKDHGDLTQYTVSYTSKLTRDALWAKYTALASAGYVIDTAQTKKADGVFIADKGGDTLTVITTTKDGVSTVRVNYLDR